MDRYPALERMHEAGSRSLVSTRTRTVVTAVPHAGSTPLLHLLARAEDVDLTLVGEDVAAWPATLRWSEADAAVAEEAARSEEWVRLTTTRDPGARLWSAWQAAMLLRSGDTDDRFGEEPWFPHRVRTVEELVERFRAFVRALDSDLLFADAAWAPQTLLMEAMPSPTHRIGFDELEKGVSLLAERLGVEADDLPAPDAALLEYVPGLLDAATAATVNRVYGPDFEELGHARLPEEDAELPAPWRARAEAMLPALAVLTEQNADRERLRRRCVEAEGAHELELDRVRRLREQFDERWDSLHENRAALVALTTRLDATEQELADARRELIDRTKGNRAPERARQRARSLARRVRNRVAASREARARG